MADPLYRRVLLKLSGEVLAGDKGFGIDPTKAVYLANEVKSIHEIGVEIGLVIGAGNIFRGMQAASQGMDRVTGDYLGMLATIMNAISVQDALEKVECETRTLSAISVSQMAEPYIRRRAIRHLEKGRIVIISGGTGNPFFTTDSAASLRAIEINAELLIKATKVDGVYSSDPVKNNDAIRYETLNYDDVIERKLGVMDTTAVVLCRENKIPLRILDMTKPGVLLRAAMGENEGTLVN